LTVLSLLKQFATPFCKILKFNVRMTLLPKCRHRDNFSELTKNIFGLENDFSHPSLSFAKTGR